MRRFLVAGNWKMHGGLKMTAELIAGIAEQLTIANQKELAIEVLLCPPSPYLAEAQQSLENRPFKLGAQNVNAQPEGAYTGEIAIPMLLEFGCDYVLLGHSERRELFAESDAKIAEKFAACIEQGIRPVLCVGETLAARQAGETEAVIEQQLDEVLAVTGIKDFANAVLAYEPVWAIGTGETATPQQAQQVHAFIRAKLAALDKNIANDLRILYGGSVKPDNAKELFSAPDIDGGLIGGAALDATSFADICKAAQSFVNQ